MKKLLISLLMLCSITAAWAGDGDGTKEHPYTGEWDASVLIPQLKKGDHLAYNCVINGGEINVLDDYLDEIEVISQLTSWAVGSLVAEDYNDYIEINSPEKRQKQTFIITEVNVPENDIYLITGHYSGCYDYRGNGSEDFPFIGEWAASELKPKLKAGSRIGLECVITGNAISVEDIRLNKTISDAKSVWIPRSYIGNENVDITYEQYGKDNSFDRRKNQSFIVAYVNPAGTDLDMQGYFSGFYSNPDADGFVHVGSAEQMWIILRGNSNVKANDHAKIKLTQNIYLSDINRDDDTFCSTFYGIFDGDGHTIYGDHYGDDSTRRRGRTYLVTYSDGATFKNFTIKQIRVDNRDHDNQCIITSQAKNNSVFENITIDNVSVYTSGSSVGAVTGKAENCTFTNITVKNSDFTANKSNSGAVVGYADYCHFANIKVDHCESTARGEAAGGVIGKTWQPCTFDSVEVSHTFIKTEEWYAGGIIGHTVQSKFTNCTVDDQSCVFAQGSGYLGEAGGIAGTSNNDTFNNCINSALVACGTQRAGGIVGASLAHTKIEDCLNTGMIISADMETVKNSLRVNYINKTGMTCVTKTYKGKEYVIRKYTGGCKGGTMFGGIIGDVGEVYEDMWNFGISRCTNLGSIYSKGDEYEHDNENGSVGGIVGMDRYVQIVDCLSDFDCSSGVKGICGVVISRAYISGCLNVTKQRDYTILDATSFYCSKNFSMTTATGLTGVTKTSETELKNGTVCHQQSKAWEQNIGTDPYPTPTGDKGLYHTRTVSGEYGTVCLPFSVKSDDNIKYYKLDTNKDDGQDIKLVFKYVEDVIKEDTPLLYRAVEAEGADADNPVEICFNSAGDGFTSLSSANHTGTPWCMWGTFDGKTIEGTSAKYYCVFSDGEFKNMATMTIPPYQTYLYLNSQTIDEFAGKSIKIVLEDKDDIATAISSLPTSEGWAGSSYSVTGTKVDSNYRGIVIQNGKKYVRK